MSKTIPIYTFDSRKPIKEKLLTGLCTQCTDGGPAKTNGLHTWSQGASVPCSSTPGTNDRVIPYPESAAAAPEGSVLEPSYTKPYMRMPIEYQYRYNAAV